MQVYVGEGERTLELLCVNKHHIVINKPSSVPVHPVGRYKASPTSRHKHMFVYLN